MKALSILQPWAWLIVRPDIVGEAQRLEGYRAGRIKDIENRGWYTPHRGRFLVHAGKKYSQLDHGFYFDEMAREHGIKLPRYSEMPLGCIAGAVDLVDCVREHASKWKVPGSWGFVLASAIATPPRPYRGQLGFFEVPDGAPSG